jgi:fructose-bisphosphate aldolase, class II
MALVSMKDMLKTARRQHYAVGGFEFWSYDSARAVVKTAERFRVPVILQVGHFERDYMDGYPNAYKLASMAAAGSDYPVALHLDHAEEYEEVMRALDAGFTSVMIDASMKPFEQNVEITCRVAEAAGRYGASVEAELGRLGGTEGRIKGGEDSNQTDPDEAAEFVRQTGIDALAVAIGTAHGFYDGIPEINIPRLKQIASKVSIPLVLHGGSGTPDEKVAEAILNGVAKVNICTEFIYSFGKAYMDVQSASGFKYNVFSLFKAAMEASELLVSNKLTLFSSDIDEA